MPTTATAWDLAMWKEITDCFRFIEDQIKLSPLKVSGENAPEMDVS